MTIFQTVRRSWCFVRHGFIGDLPNVITRRLGLLFKKMPNQACATRDQIEAAGTEAHNPDGLEGALTVGFDLGVMYQGQADVDLDSEDGLLSDDAVLQANLAIEEDEVEDDLEDFVVYPVVGLALIYRF